MVNADVGAANVVVLGSEVGYYLPVLLVAGEGREGSMAKAGGGKEAENDLNGSDSG